jgi:formate dehydrogenase major subunit
MSLIEDIDYGTPAKSGANVRLTIDGKSIDVPEGTSIMRAAQIAGTAIPKLCATDSMEAFGSRSTAGRVRPRPAPRRLRLA